MKILFWNLKNNKVEKYVAGCALENDVDIISLAEYNNIDRFELCNRLGPSYRQLIGLKDNCKTCIIAKDTVEQIKGGRLFEQDRHLIWSFKYYNKNYNIVVLHLVDRMSENDSSGRCHYIRRIVSDLKQREIDIQSSNSIVIGDFNANPYDEELVSLDTFNATLFKDVIKNRQTRVYQGEEFEFMYNPIVHFLSEDKKCYGSYYWSNSFKSTYWYCYDQAIVSKDLVDSVSDLEYVREICGESLVLSAGPLNRVSDHLPLLLKLKGGYNG